jgi:Ca-activated chloride channel family protein
MSPRRIPVPRVSPLAALAAASALGSVCAIWVASGVGFLPEEPMLAELEVIPERFVTVELAPAELQRSAPPAPRLGALTNPGSPRGALDLAGRLDGAPEAAGCPLEGVEVASRSVDKEIAESAGVLGALSESGSSSAGLSSDLLGGVGGLIGAHGVQVGASGLASRGSGLGGGGSAASIGGLGTKGRGSGGSAVAYGRGVGHTDGVRAKREEGRAGRNSERYTDHGVNPMTDTTADGLSTFSIDVDTASYAIARRKLQGGIMPPPAAVRVEEFVNYLPYDYAAPRGGQPFAVHMEAAPSPYQPGHHLLRVGVKGKVLEEAHRPPVRLTFLVDVSGSMSSPDKLGLAQQALHFLVAQLGVEDSVAIATYAGRVERVLPPTPTTRKSHIHAAIDSLSSGGSTAMSSGIDLAYGMASQAYVEGAENRVIVLSDGDANVGPASHSAILDSISEYAGRGITLSTIGFGMGNYKDTLMEQLADRGDGNYHYVDSMREAEKIFGQDLAGTIRTIARDVKIQVEFDPEQVLAYRLVGYENRDIADCDFRNDKVDAGEVGSGHRVTALYDVVLVDGASGPVATVRMRAKPPGPDAPAAEWRSSFDREDVVGSFASASPDLRVAAGVAGFAEKLRGSRYVEEISYRQIATIVRDAQRGHEEDGELLELIGRAAELTGEGAIAQR